MTTSHSDVQASANKFIDKWVDRYIQRILSQPHKWVHFSKIHCGKYHRKEIFDRVRSTLSLMGVETQIPREVYYYDNRSPYTLRVKSEPKKPR